MQTSKSRSLRDLKGEALALFMAVALCGITPRGADAQNDSRPATLRGVVFDSTEIPTHLPGTRCASAAAIVKIFITEPGS